MLEFESGPSGHLYIQKHLGLPVTVDQEHQLQSSLKRMIFHAEKKANKSRKLFAETVAAAKAATCAVPDAKDVEAEDEEGGEDCGYIPGGCELPAPSGLKVSEIPMYEGSFVAVASPGELGVWMLLYAIAQRIIAALSPQQ